MEVFTHAIAATTDVTYATSNALTATTAYGKMPGGVADALLITATVSSGLELTLPDGSALALGNQVLGTYIRIQHTKAKFSAGTCLALAR